MKTKNLLILIFASLSLAGCDQKEPNPPSTDPDQCQHVDANKDHKCDKCEYKMSEHEDKDKNHVCDYCLETISTCADNDKNHKCDYCGSIISECEDANKDHKCDICGRTLSVHKDENKDHYCDYCLEKMSEHADLNSDHKCDTCGEVLSSHKDENKDHNCDLCGQKMSEHKDENKDHKCDVCGQKMSEHSDNNKDHKCDLCGEKISDHADANKDHKCDTCGITMSTCEDLNDDLKCDYCGKTLEFYAYVAFKSDSYSIVDTNRLTYDSARPNIYSLTISAKLGDVIKVLNTSKTFSSYDEYNVNVDNAFANSLVKKQVDGTLKFNATGKYIVELDRSNDSVVSVFLSQINSYMFSEGKGSISTYQWLGFSKDNSRPSKLTYKYNSYSFLVDQWIQIKDPEGNRKHFTLSETSFKKVFILNDDTNWSTITFKGDKNDLYNITLTVDVETYNLELDFSYIGKK